MTQQQSDQSQQSRQAILEAAFELIRINGYRGTTMADVAHASGLPIGSLYWHFKNKEELFAALLRDRFETWISESEKVAENGDPQLFFAEFGGELGVLRDHRGDFWGMVLLLVLEPKLEKGIARSTYLSVRNEMFTQMVRWAELHLPEAAIEADPDLSRNIVTLLRSTREGMYVARAAGDDVNFSEFSSMAILTVQSLVREALQDTGWCITSHRAGRIATQK